MSDNAERPTSLTKTTGRNLPSRHLPPQSRRLFLVEIKKGRTFSMKEEQELSAMPIQSIRQVLQAKIASLGNLLTRQECDGCLRLLALTLPRAGLLPADAHDMLDLYFGLLRKAGMTGPMLRAACERYVMRSTDGKGKFFPDPGQLLDMCRGEATGRLTALSALERGIELLDGKFPEPADSWERMHIEDAQKEWDQLGLKVAA